MSTPDRRKIARAMRRLCDAERERSEAIAELIDLGAIRGRAVVASLGEAIASVYYDAPLAPSKTQPGYDLITHDGRKVQVRALKHALPGYERNLIGTMRDPYDTLFAVKLDAETFEPLRAIEVPRNVLEEYFPHGERVTWLASLEDDEDVKRIPGEQLLYPWSAGEPLLVSE
jgi:Family of unknown function (DUF6998)